MRFRSIFNPRNESKSKATSVNIRKYAFIDSLRGIAFLGVFLCHASTQLAVLGCPERFYRLGFQGGIGVQLFFIASALTLMLSLDARSVAEKHPVQLLPPPLLPDRSAVLSRGLLLRGLLSGPPIPGCLIR